MHRGSGYFGDRLRRAWDVLSARTQIAMDKMSSNGSNSNGQKSENSMAYNLEILGMEHDRAFDNYVPRPYHGDVLLFQGQQTVAGHARRSVSRLGRW